MWGTAVRHELNLQWRTRRALVMVAVFVLFGLASPMLAKVHAGTAQKRPWRGTVRRAHPRTDGRRRGGAIHQKYHPVWLYFGHFAGDGGRGGREGQGHGGNHFEQAAASLGLFAEQVCRAGGGLPLWRCCWARWRPTTTRWCLFEPLALGPFLFGGFLLWLWTLVYTAVTLLGSTMAKSIGGGAGLALLGAVLLLILGGIPQVAQFFPRRAGGLGVPAWSAGGRAV